MLILKYNTNELIYKTKQSHRQQTCGQRAGEGWDVNWRLADTNYHVENG